MFLPCALLLAFAIRQRITVVDHTPPYESPDQPNGIGHDESVAGWEGTLDVGAGCTLTARLERLHPDDTRQRFDAAALARAIRSSEIKPSPSASPGASGSSGAAEALGTARSEPWRLTLLGADSSGNADENRDRILLDRLSGVRVRGLEPLVPPGERRPGDVFDGPVDPLRALLRFPDVVLTPGEQCDLVYWGPAPGGLAGDATTVQVLVTLPGFDEPLVLSPKGRAGASSTQSLAYVDEDQASTPGLALDGTLNGAKPGNGEESATASVEGGTAPPAK